MRVCENCSMQIDKGHVCKKCDAAYFCSTSCYLTTMESHKSVCPGMNQYILSLAFCQYSHKASNLSYFGLENNHFSTYK